MEFHRIHGKKVPIEFGLSGVDEFTQRLEKSDFQTSTFIEMLKEGERKEEDPMLFYANPHLHDYAGHVDMNGGP